MATVLANSGSAVSKSIVRELPAGRANKMVSFPALAFALVIACRNDPVPESFVFVTSRGGLGVEVGEGVAVGVTVGVGEGLPPGVGVPPYSKEPISLFPAR